MNIGNEGLKETLERVEKDSQAFDSSKVKWPFKRVLNQHLIVQINAFKYTGKIIVPETAKRKPTTGIVVGKAADVTDIEVGDTILFSQFAGTLLKFADVPLCRVIGYAEVIAILTENSPELESESV